MKLECVAVPHPTEPCHTLRHLLCFVGILLWNLTAKGGLICPCDVLHTVEVFKKEAIAVNV